MQQNQPPVNTAMFTQRYLPVNLSLSLMEARTRFSGKARLFRPKFKSQNQ
jgi:hypothetical protein